MRLFTKGNKDCDEKMTGAMKNTWMLLAAVCVLVIGVYGYMTQSPTYEPWKSLTPDAARAQYSLLVQGFRAGQLSLKIDVPPGLT